MDVQRDTHRLETWVQMDAPLHFDLSPKAQSGVRKQCSCQREGWLFRHFPQINLPHFLR
jgi:hypothetical protein